MHTTGQNETPATPAESEDRMTTIDQTVTDEQIVALYDESAQAGDGVCAALCIIALGGPRRDIVAWALRELRASDYARVRQAGARAECERVILYARGEMADEASQS